MKLKNTKSKIKQIAKSVLVLGLAVIFATNPLMSELSFAANQSTIKWTRVKSYTELMSAVYKCNSGTYDTSLKSDNSNAEWKPILIVHGNQYMVTGGGYSTATGTSGMDFSRDSFTSRGYYNTPFVKVANVDNCDFYLANRSGDGVSDQGIGCNMSWWGVKYYAACRSRMATYKMSDPGSSAFKEGWSCNCTMETGIQIDQHGETFSLRWNTHRGNVCDRWLHYDYDFSKGSGYNDFMIYIGEQGSGAVQSINTQIQPYMSTKICDMTIDNNVETIVQEGSTLILDGACFNSGHILVDGGTLVIRGYLDADYGGSAGTSMGGSFNPSDITVKNGGKLIIEKNGVLLHRNSSSSITVTDNSSVYVEGTMCVGHNFTLGDGCILRAMPGSFIGFGIGPYETTYAKSYTPANIKASSSASLSSVAKSDGYSGTVSIGNNASFISYGAVFRGANTVIKKGTCYFEAKVSTNINASFASMMNKW